MGASVCISQAELQRDVLPLVNLFGPGLMGSRGSVAAVTPARPPLVSRRLKTAAPPAQRDADKALLLPVPAGTRERRSQPRIVLQVGVKRGALAPRGNGAERICINAVLSGAGPAL